MSKINTVFTERQIVKDNAKTINYAHTLQSSKGAEIFGIDIPHENLPDTLLFLFTLFVIVFFITFILKICLSYIFGAIVFLFPAEHKCKYCGKKFKYENQNVCPFCQKSINDEIKPH